MMNTNSLYVIEFRSAIASIKRTVNALILLLGVCSFAYFVYYGGAISDEILLEYTGHIFKPLAAFLNPGNESLEIYKLTSLYLFLAIFPVAMSHYFLDKIEECAIKLSHFREEKRLIKESRKAYLDSLKQYDVIKSYSICLSLDYDFNKKVSLQTKKALSEKLYVKIQSALSKLSGKIKVLHKEALIINSNDFENYDFIYSSLIKILARVKKSVEKNYDCKFIASITTDAYCEEAESENIIKNHFEIQSFNFKNRALTSAMFSKKYRHLNHKQYAGIPIGEYVSSDSNTGTYELNVVFKDLSRTLETA